MDLQEKKPRALVYGDDDFLGFYLKEFLQKYGCEIVSEKAIGNVVIDYIFVLKTKTQKELADLILLAEKNSAKILIHSDNGKELVFSKSLDFRFVSFAGVYGPRMPADEFCRIEKNPDLYAKKLLYVSDVVYGIAKAMFSTGTRGGKYIFSPSGWMGMTTNEQLNWRSVVDWEEGWSRTKEWFSKTASESSYKLPILIKEKFPKISSSVLRPKFLLLFLVSFFFFLLPLLFFAAEVYLVARNLNQTKMMILGGDFRQGADYARKAAHGISLIDVGLNYSQFIFDFIGQKSMIQKIRQDLETGKNLSLAAVRAGEVAKIANGLTEKIFFEGGVDKTAFQQIGDETEKIYEFLSLAQPRITDSRLAKQIQESRTFLLNIKPLINYLPDLIGLNGRRVYLLLFQNNTELRPTGGFIGSFGLLTLDKGKIADLEIEDVYSADGHLKGHVEPPPSLKKYLGEAGWYLRDSNWDPDFPTTAVRAAWFLEKEIGRTVDGVIGINLNFVQKLLRETGEIEVFDFNEKINADNLFERAEYHSEVNFFPGSTQKRDFLGAIARTLFEKFRKDSDKATIGLAKSAYLSLISKDLLIAVNDPAPAEVFSSLGWDGGIKEIACSGRTDSCLIDYLMVVEANVGVNKANYFLTRDLSHRVKITEEGIVEETLNILYYNGSQTEIFPAGNYKSFFRAYLPLGAELKSVFIKDPDTGSQSELSPAEIDFSQEHNRSVWGFLIEVPIKQSRVVEINYRLGEKISPELTEYRFAFQKQSGIEDRSFAMIINSDSVRPIIQFKPLAKLTSEGIVFSERFDRDLIFDAVLAKKE